MEGELLKKKMEGEQEMPAVLLMEQGGEVIGSRRDEISHFIPFLTSRWYVLKVGTGDAVLNNLSTDIHILCTIAIVIQKLVQQCWDFFLEHWVKVEVCI